MEERGFLDFFGNLFFMSFLPNLRMHLMKQNIELIIVICHLESFTPYIELYGQNMNNVCAHSHKYIQRGILDKS